ncbi:DUF2182 domain-containing protein [Aliiroseovarius sp. PrR006]|uniref:DUF2182 domain-containing protein n=1 Tax=Aliiroseovarius sp. PrR006 TaxID=2706883 RepID=UPI0013D005C5|nr:DUF2182 domain-containing protein [Aliiroseovarius sp. PrR006]NDW53918.1 DUF2182 domain-containing protein [Aliiroseovarius sp. PrR006]
MDNLNHPNGPGAIERLLGADRAIVLSAVALIVLFSAVYTVLGIGMQMSAIDMTRMARPIGNPMAMGTGPTWTIGYIALTFLMWWVMMIAMMTPSATPTLLLYSAMKRVSAEPESTPQYTLFFLFGYLLSWAAFSAFAVALQSKLQSLGLISPQMMTLNSQLIAGIVLIGAGLYQFTSLKQACLRRCQSPAQFLTKHRRTGKTGALLMGVHHGSYCLGCCWALMALLFVGGVMNLYWITGLAIYVALEKLTAQGQRLARVAGVALFCFGAYLLLAHFSAV